MQSTNHPGDSDMVTKLLSGFLNTLAIIGVP